jgi:purine-binding chemotaxis protein CheW
MKLLVFRLGGDDYALPVASVREIVEARPPRAIPAQEPWQLGVVSVRGQIVPVWDLAARLGLVASPDRPAGLLVLLDASPPVAVVVDEVVGIRDLPDEALSPLPLMPEARGIGTLGDGLVVVLEPDSVLGIGDELEALPRSELLRRARDAGIADRTRLPRAELIAALRGR